MYIPGKTVEQCTHSPLDLSAADLGHGDHAGRGREVQTRVQQGTDPGTLGALVANAVLVGLREPLLLPLGPRFCPVLSTERLQLAGHCYVLFSLSPIIYNPARKERKGCRALGRAKR